VELKLLPGSAAQVDVRTSGGRITQRGVTLNSQQQERRALSGSLGSPQPGAVLSIQTSSGDVVLSQ
jgi:hypothetical protein